MIKTKEEIDHTYTTEITCPYCGYEDNDSWEVSDEHGFMDCGSCEKQFHYERDVTVTYSTKKCNTL